LIQTGADRCTNEFLISAMEELTVTNLTAGLEMVNDGKLLMTSIMESEECFLMIRWMLLCSIDNCVAFVSV